jgi:pyrroloquinoline-quinone synthase
MTQALATDAARSLDRLDELVASRSILNHPFYQAWSEGKLTRDHLRTYAEVYYPHVRAFTGYLERAIVGAEDPETRRTLVDNLVDELSRPEEHAALWRRFAAGMGTADPAERHSRAAATVETFERLCAAGTVEALAALYAYESQQPEVAATKIAGLREHYGVRCPEALRYFEVHREADVEHRNGEREALRRALETGASEDAMLAAAGAALKAYWGLLDAVCAETGIAA